MLQLWFSNVENTLGLGWALTPTNLLRQLYNLQLLRDNVPTYTA
jgi:hypothetical protein